MLVGSLVVGLLSYLNTGHVLPKTPDAAAIYQNALLLIVLGSAILEYKFTKPADAAVNSLMGMITLLTIFGATPALFWWLIFGYCALVFVTAVICIALSAGSHIGVVQSRVVDIAFRVSTRIGGSRLLFSIVFLFALFSFYTFGSRAQLRLLLFWGIFVAIWPLRLPDLLSTLFRRTIPSRSVGQLARFDHPNIVRVTIDPHETWTHTDVRILSQPDGTQRYIVPLYSQFEEDRRLGTGLIAAECKEVVGRPSPGMLYESETYSSATEGQVAGLLGAAETAKLIGFVVEGSIIESIRFEIWDIDACREGSLVWCDIGEQTAYYQVVAGTDVDEALGSHRHGYQVAQAAQLGVVQNSHMRKFEWLPAMNAPVFTQPVGFGEGLLEPHEDDFVFGTIADTLIKVTGPFVDKIPFHTAILGVTGTGKTVLTHDLIRHALNHDVKVLAIDITAQYEQRLSDLAPQMLSLDEDIVDDLGTKLFDAETGQYGAGAEKKVLQAYSSKLRENILYKLNNFLLADDVDSDLGLITLREISNTKATLYVTEMYLSSLFRIAKENLDKLPTILVVVEEAHTVMPETGTMGIGDYDSRGLVAKIAQIALQGRKYGIGLLVVAQRTATVSKTVLTQCNNVISFATFDDTSLGFLSNIFGHDYVKLVPNLPALRAVVHGPAFRAEMPVVVSIPYSTDKDWDGLFQEPPP